MIEAIRTTKAHKVDLPSIHIHRGMEEYSGWGWIDHVRWFCDISGLPFGELYVLVSDGYQVFTDEEVSEVWLLSKNNYRSTARLLYEESA